MMPVGGRNRRHAECEAIRGPLRTRSNPPPNARCDVCYAALGPAPAGIRPPRTIHLQRRTIRLDDAERLGRSVVAFAFASMGTGTTSSRSKQPGGPDELAG